MVARGGWRIPARRCGTWQKERTPLGRGQYTRNLSLLVIPRPHLTALLVIYDSPPSAIAWAVSGKGVLPVPTSITCVTAGE